MATKRTNAAKSNLSNKLEEQYAAMFFGPIIEQLRAQQASQALLGQSKPLVTVKTYVTYAVGEEHPGD